MRTAAARHENRVVAGDSSRTAGQGQKQSQIVNAEGSSSGDPRGGRPGGGAPARRASQAQVVSQALGWLGDPAQHLIAQRYLESLSQIATNAQKLVSSCRMIGVVSACIRELLQTPAK